MRLLFSVFSMCFPSIVFLFVHIRFPHFQFASPFSRFLPFPIVLHVLLLFFKVINLFFRSLNLSFSLFLSLILSLSLVNARSHFNHSAYQKLLNFKTALLLSFFLSRARVLSLSLQKKRHELAEKSA